MPNPDCPHCGGGGSMVARLNYFKCEKCGGTVRMGRKKRGVGVEVTMDTVEGWLCGKVISEDDWVDSRC